MSGPEPGALPGPGGVPQRAPVPANGRGVIALVEQNCTVCMICVRECPDWCIYVEGHQESRTEPGARARSHNVLDRFAIDFSLCMYCGICVEVCPFDALHWSPEHDYAVAAALDLTHEKERLGAWESTVPTRTVDGEHPDSGAPEAPADRS